MGEHQQAVVCRVQGEIHQDINAILSHLPGDLFGADSRDVAPFIRLLPQPICHEIRPGHLRITEDFKFAVIMMLNQRHHASADRVITKILGNIADPQSTVRAAIIAMLLR